MLRDLAAPVLRDLAVLGAARARAARAGRAAAGLRELADPLLRRRVGLDVVRSDAGISSRATAFASVGICPSRNFAIRSSSRRMPRASFAVSLSPTASASASIDV